MQRTRCKPRRKDRPPGVVEGSLPGSSLPLPSSSSLVLFFYVLFVFLTFGEQCGTKEGVYEELNSFHIVICVKSQKE